MTYAGSCPPADVETFGTMYSPRVSWLAAQYTPPNAGLVCDCVAVEEKNADDRATVLPRWAAEELTAFVIVHDTTLVISSSTYTRDPFCVPWPPVSELDRSAEAGVIGQIALEGLRRSITNPIIGRYEWRTVPGLANYDGMFNIYIRGAVSTLDYNWFMIESRDGVLVRVHAFDDEVYASLDDPEDLGREVLRGAEHIRPVAY